MRVHRISARDLGPARLASVLAGLGLLTAVIAAPATHADALADVQLLRQSGCGGVASAAGLLHHVAQLDQTAAQWARGRSLAQAAGRTGYQAQQLAGVHVTGSGEAVLQTLRHTSCVTIMNRRLADVGIYQRGADAWVVLASSDLAPIDTAPQSLMRPRQSTRAPAASRSATFAARVLELVNATRARGTSCGRRAFAPTGPVHLSTVLDQVAYGHALDMAEHDYFEHQDLTGHTPADRVRAAGYPEKLVGENIAYGPVSPEEVVRGWLDSPGHCENIMDPRFAEMGLASAFGHAPQPASGAGLYWVQLLADPKS